MGLFGISLDRSIKMISYRIWFELSGPQEFYAEFDPFWLIKNYGGFKSALEYCRRTHLNITYSYCLPSSLTIANQFLIQIPSGHPVQKVWSQQNQPWLKWFWPVLNGSNWFTPSSRRSVWRPAPRGRLQFQGCSWLQTPQLHGDEEG